MAIVHDRVVLEGNADAVEFCPHSPLLAAATYTLLQEPQPRRLGSITLFQVQQQQQEAEDHRPSLRQLHRVETSGVFDIKWRPGSGDGAAPACLAQAGSDGSIGLYCLDEGGTGNGMILREAQRQLASSSMCLSLEWDPFHINSSHSRIVISHSDGSLSIIGLDQGGLELDQTWQAHDFEVWTTTFDFWKPSVVYSGADDSHFCVWDLREDLQTPVYRNKRVHRMGVCCVQSNHLCEHVLVTGSYDETIRLWDSRMLQNPVLEAELGLGGGVWKVKWHPSNGKLLLAACMHNGFAILHANGSEVEILQEYKGHKSLAYGADWYRGKSKSSVELKDHQEETQLGCQPGVEMVSRQAECPSLVATCSFYDSALHLWEPRSCPDHKNENITINMDQ